MDNLSRTLTALALGLGIGLAAAGGAIAQPEKTPCPPASESADGLQGSEDQRQGARTGREAGTETASAETGAKGQAVGSVTQDVKRGGCPDIEDLSAETE